MNAPMPALRRLARLRARARLILWVEALWPAVWPALGVGGVFICAALLGVQAALPATARLAALGGTLALMVGLLWRGLRRLRRPDRASIDRRLERDSGLSHRPLAVLADRPAGGVETPLWQAHRAWALAALPRLRLGWPRPGLAMRDRIALRGALVVALAAALVIAGPAAPSRLRAAMLPPLPHLPGAPATELAVWLTPPEFAQTAPIFLHPGQRGIRVPAGTRVAASLTGGAGAAPKLANGGATGKFTTLAAGSYRTEAVLRGGTLAVRRDGATLAEWQVTLVAAHPPRIGWAAPPGPDAAHGALTVRFPWQAEGQYGLTQLAVSLRPDARPDAPALILPLSLPQAQPADAQHGAAWRDLTDHPWAGLAVTARLIATDAAGSHAASAPARFVLPARVFHNPVARALVAIRQHLSLDPQDRDSAVGGLDTLLIDPAAFDGDLGAYLNTGAIYYALEYDHGPGAIARIQARLWRLALHLEDGAAARSEMALEAARAAMRKALAQAEAHPDPASRAALTARLQALRVAIANRLAALMAQQHAGSAASGHRAAMTLRADTLERLAEAAGQAAAANDMARARQDVRALEQMLDRLRQARPGLPDPDQAAAQKRARQALATLDRLIQGETTVLDHAQLRTQRLTDAADAAQRRDDAVMQRMLRQSLGGLARGMADAGTPIPAGMAQAEAGMTQALDALGAARDGEAGNAAQRALAGLQAGAGSMMAAAGAGQPGGPPGGMEAGRGGAGGEAGMDATGAGLDPLGRALQSGAGGTAQDEESGVVLPGTPGDTRLRAIEQELRRRDADRTRPRQERAYIGRLLNGL
ncbi:MAG: DUF4175 family protein [Rhodospirillales bacterium]|nr:DUF4175 family protein [Rhodospirillales bacterium]